MTLVAILRMHEGSLELAHPKPPEQDFICDDGRVAIFNNSGACHNITVTPRAGTVRHASVGALVPSSRALWAAIDSDMDSIEVQVDAEMLGPIPVKNRSNLVYAFVDVDGQFTSTRRSCCSNGSIVVVNGCCDGRELSVGPGQPVIPGHSLVIEDPATPLIISNNKSTTTLEITVVDHTASEIHVTKGPVLLNVSSHVAQPDASDQVHVVNDAQECVVLEYGGVCRCLGVGASTSVTVDPAAEHQLLISLHDDDPDPKVVIKHTRGDGGAGGGRA